MIVCFQNAKFANTKTLNHVIF